MGNILSVNVHAANKHDTKGGVFVFEKALFWYPSIKASCADAGYRGTFKNTFEIFHNLRIDISMQIKSKFEVLPMRWRVERTFAWLGNSRRLSKDYEIKASSEENIIYISHLHTLLKRL
jgi:putative transposase